MAEILKPVPTVEGLEINHDGTIIYYKGKLKNIVFANHVNGKKYKQINLLNKTYSVSHLVFTAFIGFLPRSRRIFFIDGNHLNTHYKNLGPKRCLMAAFTQMKKVPGFDELFINSNGTVLSQYGYEINIRPQRCDKRSTYYYAACINVGNQVKYSYISILVAKAYLNWSGKGKVLHRDGNTSNNHFENLQPLTLKQYGKRNLEILKKARAKCISRQCAIPKSDTEQIKERLLKGATLREIADEYNCTDMSIVRFKKRHFTTDQINKINQEQGINTVHTPDNIVKEVIKHLKKGRRQSDIAKHFALSPTVVCRINRRYIRKE